LGLFLVLILVLVNVESRRLISNKDALKRQHVRGSAQDLVGEECQSSDETTDGVCAATQDCPDGRKIAETHKDRGCVAEEVCCHAEAVDVREKIVAKLHVGIETDMIDFGELYHCNLMFLKYLSSKDIEVTFYDGSENEQYDYSEEDIILINTHGASNGALIGNKQVNWFFKANTYKAAIKYWVFACFIKANSYCFANAHKLLGKQLMGFFPGQIINSCYKAGKPGFLLSAPSTTAGYVEAFKLAYGMYNPTVTRLWELDFEPKWPNKGPDAMDITVLETLLEQFNNKAGSSFVSLDEIFSDQLA